MYIQIRSYTTVHCHCSGCHHSHRLIHQRCQHTSVDNTHGIGMMLTCGESNLYFFFITFNISAAQEAPESLLALFNHFVQNTHY
ncbi:hypothetical protein D3C73_1483190 [compost metagenome]